MTRHRPHHEVELYREGDAYVVVAELPNADPDAVEIDWVDGHLHVAAEVDHDGRTRVVTRRVSVPKAVDVDGITAIYEDGVLEVELPIVSDERPRGIRIDVN